MSNDIKHSYPLQGISRIIMKSRCALEVAQEEEIRKFAGKEESQGSCTFEILQADHEEKGNDNKEKTQGPCAFEISQACSEETNCSKEEQNKAHETKGQNQNKTEGWKQSSTVQRACETQTLYSCEAQSESPPGQ